MSENGRNSRTGCAKESPSLVSSLWYPLGGFVCHCKQGAVCGQGRPFPEAHARWRTKRGPERNVPAPALIPHLLEPPAPSSAGLGTQECHPGWHAHCWVRPRLQQVLAPAQLPTWSWNMLSPWRPSAVSSTTWLMGHSLCCVPRRRLSSSAMRQRFRRENGPGLWAALP